MKAIESYGSPHWLPQLVLSALVCFLVMFSAGVWFKMQDWKAEQQPVEQAAVNSYSWQWKTTDIKEQVMRLLIWSHLIGCWSILSGAIWAVLKCLRYRRPTKLPADKLFPYSRLPAVSKIGLVGTQLYSLDSLLGHTVKSKTWAKILKLYVKLWYEVCTHQNQSSDKENWERRNSNYHILPHSQEHSLDCWSTWMTEDLSAHNTCRP